MNRRRYTIAVVCGLGVFAHGCSSVPEDDFEPTIKILEHNKIEINRGADLQIGRKEVIAGYRKFLSTLPDYPLRAETMRRLADLEMEQTDERFAEGVKGSGEEYTGAPGRGVDDMSQYKNTVSLYRKLLKAYPHYPGNDRVLYQLAKAYDHIGEQRKSLQALDRLVEEYPDTEFLDEANFRRGELLFTFRDYKKAEHAYRAVIDNHNTVFQDKALFMQGWSLFKQARYKASLSPFFDLVDTKFVGKGSGTLPAAPDALSRGDQELLDDTLRAVTLSFSYLDGPKSIKAFFSERGHREYEHRVYQRLGALYIKQERIRDAASTYSSFIQSYPLHDQSPQFQLNIINAYREGRFASQQLAAKEEFVRTYGVRGRYWNSCQADKRQWLEPRVKKHLVELANHYHAQGQKTGDTRHYVKAAHWYEEFVASFPQDTSAPSMNFLLAESLFESRQYKRAVEEYEKTAYLYPRHEKSSEAGYAALLAYDKQGQFLRGEDKLAWGRRAMSSSLQFADKFPDDKRAPVVMTKVAEDFFAAGDLSMAETVAERVVNLQPPADSKLRRTAWTVIAHAQFDKGAFDQSEVGYQQVLKLTPANHPERKELTERLASSIYKQGEHERAAGNHREAARHFLRVGQQAPQSSIRATADYDAAASYLALQDWPSAAKVLEGFRKNYPGDPLQSKVSEKLATVYLKQGKSSKAAGEFEHIAASSRDPQTARDAAWQAAELYQKTHNTQSAIRAYERYIKRFPRPLEQAIEARHNLAQIYKAKRDSKQWGYWLNEIILADKKGGRERTDRTRYLGAEATFLLAEPYYAAFRQVRLVRPLKRSLKVKKQKMQDVLKAYGRAADYGVAGITTACTYRIAEIYNDFSHDLLESQRPKGLSPEELEQYNILLEEQAYPFEEKAIEAHETNTKRVSEGIYDKWVKSSFASLGKLRPARYAKKERGEEMAHDIH